MLFAVYSVVKASKPAPVPPPYAEPARAPFTAFVAGAGLIEASSRNIGVGTPVGGIIEKVYVKVGDKVKAGDALFSIDARELKAELAVREAQVKAAREQVDRLKKLPRPEELPPLQARVREAEQGLADAKAQYEMINSAALGEAAGREEVVRRRIAVASAEARVEQARAQLALTEAGAWGPDVAIAQAQVESAEAQLAAARVEIERRTVTAPVAGEVLQVEVLPGEFAAAGAAARSLLQIGATDVLHVRVDVDEHDAWRVKGNAKGYAALRGNAQISTQLRFVRFEPLVVPKRSLTGDSTERVDTRVLQVIYAFDKGTLPVFVGQQMDVFIEADAVGERPVAVEEKK
jgi:multidrug efflux pump subunit AcrA (membrane-fusion protein)